MELEKMYTVSDIAEMLTVSDRTVRNFIENGELIAYRFGREYKVKETDLKAFIENSKVVTGETPDTI